MKTTGRRTVSHAHLRIYTALSMVPLLGATRSRTLLRHFTDPEQIFQADPRALTALEGIGPVTAQQICTFEQWDEVDRVLENTRRYGAHLVAWNDPRRSPLLKEIFDPPLLLWVLGDPGLLSVPGVAVVGTRRPSRYGLASAERFSTDLVQQGFCVTSGLAYGIDATAHRAAVDAGGKTVAVLGSGVDRIYPRRNAPLARDIIRSGGAVISEYPPGTKPRPAHFPVRNRIVSGITLGTLVIESGLEGGSMITANSALNQNREVFAIPHALDSGAGVGNNRLIQQCAAKLVVDVADLLQELPRCELPPPSPREEQVPAWEDQEMDELSREICRLLNKAPRHIDELCLSLDVASPQLFSRLLDLEMKKCVRQKAGRIFEISR